MWAELVAATADWSPIMWLGAIGGAGGAIAAAGARSRQGRAQRSMDRIEIATVRAHMMRAQLNDMAARPGKLAASVNREVVGVSKNGKTWRGTIAADGKLNVPTRPVIEDWCAGCNHLRGRKQMRWAEDGTLWVCRWCAKGDVPPEGWCNCPDCQVFGQNAAHLPAHVVQLGPLAQAAAEKAASASDDLHARLVDGWTAGDDYAPHRLIPLLAAVPPTQVGGTTFHGFLGDAKAELRRRGAGSIHKVTGGYEVRS